MKRFCDLLLIGLLAVSCGQDETIKVNVAKAMKQRVSAKDLYAEVEMIPLRCPAGTALGQQDRVLEVTADRFFLLDQTRHEVLVFDRAGAYLTSVKSDAEIIDISVYQDRILDVLTAESVAEYATVDCSQLAKYAFQNEGVTLRCAARISDNSIFMFGSKDGTAYDCGYLIDKNRFYSDKRTNRYLLAYLPAEEHQHSRFFRCGDGIYSFLSRSGEVFRYWPSEFASPFFTWDFGKWAPTFTNVQRTDERVYLAYEADGQEGVLVYDVARKSGKAISQTVEGLAFPLGVIYAGSNFYCCSAEELSRYLPPDRLKGGEGLVMLRFAL